MSTFNYRLLIDALSDRGFEHCKSQVYPLLDYQFLTFEEVRKVDFCETVHDLTELYLSKAGPKGVAALEFYLSAVENSIVNTVKCKRGSLAEEYKNHALKLIKDLKGKSDEESEEKYEKLLTVFSIYLSLLRETFPDFVRKEAAEVSLMVNGCDEELLKKVKEYKVKKDFPILFKKNTTQALQSNEIIYIHNCILYCNLMELQGEYGRGAFSGSVD